MDKYHLYDNLECKSNEETIIYPTFESMQLREELLKGIYTYGFKRPSVIQQRALVPIIQRRDVVIQGQKNTGKTTVISLSVLSVIDLSVKEIQVLILSKTRELAEQSRKIAMALGNFLNVSIHSCSDENSIKDDISILQDGVQIVSGTLDRVFDLIQRKELSFSHLKMIILDQADEMLIDKSKPEVQDVYKYLPFKIQKIVMTSTISQEILDLINKFINNSLMIQSKTNERTLEGIKQYFVQLDKEDWKFETLCDLYDQIDIAQSIIFCSSKQKCEWLKNKMIEKKFSVVQIHENMSQNERDNFMMDFKSGNKRVLIVNDFWGRCLDSEQVHFIINYDIPISKELYIHRIGRTGKFGRKSVAINFVISNEVKILQEFEQYYSTQIEELPINFPDFL